MRVLAIAAILAVAAAARADDLDDARKLEASLEYERALALVTQAIARGGATPDHLADLELEAGKLAAGLDRPDDAEAHFARALALRPALALPAGSSPKLTAPFEAARARTAPLAITHARTGAHLGIAVAGDSLHLVVAARATFVDAAGHRQELVTRDGPPFELALPAGARDIEVAALDEHGNLLYVASEAPLAPLAIAQPAVPGPRWYGRWSTWAAVAGLGLVATGTCAWRLGVAQDEWNRLHDDPTAHEYSQLRAVEDRGRTWALATNVALGITAAGATLAVLAYATAREPSRLALTVGPSSVGVAGQF